MSWRSRASTATAAAEFGTWRGRPLDVKVLFAPHDTWDQMTRQLRGGYFRGNCQETPLCVVSLAMFPRSASGQFRQCAGGAFDTVHRTMAGLIAGARRGSVVRIGWEANSRAGHPWQIGTAADVGPYKECFRRLAGIHKEAGLLVEWTNAKGQAFPYMETYPGDDVVDLWGLRRNGDNPEYVRRMFEQFRSSADDLAYKTYFNRSSEHMLHPSTRYPRAAQAYRELWGR